MNVALYYLIGLLVLFIVVVFIGWIIRKIDYKLQIQGKIPEHKIKEDIPFENPSDEINAQNDMTFAIEGQRAAHPIPPR